MKEAKKKAKSPPDFHPATNENECGVECVLWFRGYLGECRGVWIEPWLELGSPFRGYAESIAQVPETRIETSVRLEKAIQPLVAGDQA
jgi:hypothetical protein